jgi:hypothetical protein
MIHSLCSILAQGGDAADATVATIVLVIELALVVVIVAGMWKVFTKAGQPGWGAIIPILNVYLLCKIAGRPGWWLILFFIPIVSIVVAILVCLDIARNFGKGAGFGVGLALLGFIFFPILGFGSAQYMAGPAK